MHGYIWLGAAENLCMTLPTIPIVTVVEGDDNTCSTFFFEMASMLY